MGTVKINGKKQRMDYQCTVLLRQAHVSFYYLLITTKMESVGN
jgi:hypothetical protein